MPIWGQNRLNNTRGIKHAKVGKGGRKNWYLKDLKMLFEDLPHQGNMLLFMKRMKKLKR